MRLIDADDMIAGKVSNHPVVIEAKCAPTAYDVDRVVEQLEEFREEAKQFGADGMLTDIIDVVKRGGVDG